MIDDFTPPYRTFTAVVKVGNPIAELTDGLTQILAMYEKVPAEHRRAVLECLAKCQGSGEPV